MLKGGYQIIRMNPNIELNETPQHVDFAYYDATHTWKKRTIISSLNFEGRVWDDFEAVFDRTDKDDVKAVIHADLNNGLVVFTKIHINKLSQVWITKEAMSIPETFVYREISKDITINIATAKYNNFTLLLKGLYKEETNEMILMDFDITGWKTMTHFETIWAEYTADTGIVILNEISSRCVLGFARNKSWYTLSLGYLYFPYITVSSTFRMKMFKYYLLNQASTFSNNAVTAFINKTEAVSNSTEQQTGKYFVYFKKDIKGEWRIDTGSMADANMNSTYATNASYKQYRYIGNELGDRFVFTGFYRMATTFKTAKRTITAGGTATFSGTKEILSDTQCIYAPFPQPQFEKFVYTFKFNVGDKVITAKNTVSMNYDNYGRPMCTKSIVLTNNYEVDITIPAGTYNIYDVEIIN